MSDSNNNKNINVWRNYKHFLAFGFGLGLSPKAPGTFGTLAGIPFFIVMANFAIIPYLAMVLILSLYGIFICDKVSEDLGVHDHPGIVWDEICGYLLTMTLIPLSLKAIIIGFCFFRIFDILKPWPISWVDKHVSGGLGIMIDDIIAAIPAWVCTFITLNYII